MRGIVAVRSCLGLTSVQNREVFLQEHCGKLCWKHSRQRYKSPETTENLAEYLHFSIFLVQYTM